MLLVIFLIVLGAVPFGYFATLNTELISINLWNGQVLTGVPLYLAILVPLCFGLLVSTIIDLSKSVFFGVKNGVKASQLTSAQHKQAELAAQVEQLKSENLRFRAEVQSWRSGAINVQQKS